jgi:hypothetical protein
VLVSGVQIAYLAIIGTQLFMIFLSIVLLIGIYKVSHGDWVGAVEIWKITTPLSFVTPERRN